MIKYIGKTILKSWQQNYGKWVLLGSRPRACGAEALGGGSLEVKGCSSRSTLAACTTKTTCAYCQAAGVSHWCCLQQWGIWRFWSQRATAEAAAQEAGAQRSGGGWVTLARNHHATWKRNGRSSGKILKLDCAKICQLIKNKSIIVT